MRSAAAYLRDFILRLLASAAASAALVGLAVFGTTLTTQSRLVNLLFEPLSLFFLPGVAVAMAWAAAAGELQKHVKKLGDNHDPTTYSVALCALAFYFVAFFWLLRRRQRRAAIATAATSA